MYCSVLTTDQVRRIHEASLLVLDRIGVGIPHPEVLSRLDDAGARVDRTAQRAWIQPDLVESSLRQCGKQYTLFGRDLSRRAIFGQGGRNYNSIAGEASWLESDGGGRRFGRLSDVMDAARLGEALPGLSVVGAMADPHEIPTNYRCVEVLATLVRHTTKPVTFWFHDRASAEYINEILVVLRGDEARARAYPLCYPFLEPISPLRFPFQGLDLLFATARLNLPVPIGPMAQMGLSAPATLAGTMVQENAEILAGICITQLIRPGMPVCYGGICHAFDMATTQMIFGGPEQAIFGVALTQMGKSYGLPVYINVGLTDAKCPDAQAGLEAGITLMLGAAAGADIFGHMGICGVDQGASLDMLVLQDEIIAYVESAMRPLILDDDILGLEAIEAGVATGRFLDQEHTVRHFRRELWFPRLLDRRYFQEWMDRGARRMEERCRDRRKALLAGPGVDPLPPEQDREISRILAAARV